MYVNERAVAESGKEMFMKYVILSKGGGDSSSCARSFLPPTNSHASGNIQIVRDVGEGFGFCYSK